MRKREGAHRSAFLWRRWQECADRQDRSIGQSPRRLPRDPAVICRAWQTQRLEEYADRSATLRVRGVHGLQDRRLLFLCIAPPGAYGQRPFLSASVSRLSSATTARRRVISACRSASVLAGLRPRLPLRNASSAA
jgi:hypothetical protein